MKNLTRLIEKKKKELWASFIRGDNKDYDKFESFLITAIKEAVKEFAKSVRLERKKVELRQFPDVNASEIYDQGEIGGHNRTKADLDTKIDNFIKGK